ncbi:glycosyltransferase [Bacteroides sp. 224]|nr:glycosyltransferase [Bacteroides sp. 224]
MKISVITVCYNSERYIKNTIESVLNQTYHNIEYIIIDGNSTDSTINIIQQYLSRISYFVSEPDKNMYDAINKGMKKATGDYIAILNSDDFYLNEHVIERLVDELKKEKNSYSGIYGNLLKYDADNKFIKKKKGIPTNYKTLLCSKKLTFVGHGTLFVSRSACLKAGDYDYVNLKAAADYDYVLRLFSQNRFKYSDVDIMGFRVHSESITSSGAINEEINFVLRKNSYDKIPYVYRKMLFLVSWGHFVLRNIKYLKISNFRFLVK